MDGTHVATQSIPTPTLYSTIDVSISARNKMRQRGIQDAFVPVAFERGAWFLDELDSTVMHCKYHGHDVISRVRNNTLFVITVNTNVKSGHSMKPMLSPYLHKDTADTSSNWRQKHDSPRSRPVFKNVLKIAQRIMDTHRQNEWIEKDLDSNIIKL